MSEQGLGIFAISAMAIFWLIKYGIPKNTQSIYHVLAGLGLSLMGVLIALLVNMGLSDVVVLKKWDWATMVTLGIGYVSIIVGLAGILKSVVEKFNPFKTSKLKRRSSSKTR